MASDEIKRRQFFENVISFILKNNFNGLDLSWDVPKEGFVFYFVSSHFLNFKFPNSN